MTDRETRNYEQAIEELNYEYRCLKNSKEYLLGSRIRKIVSYVKSFNLVGLFKKIHQHNRVKRANRLYCDIKTSDSDCVDKICQGSDSDEKKIVTVYMCVIGGYDVPLSPLVLKSGHRYVLYTDKEQTALEGWEVRGVPDKLKGQSANYINRYMKLRPWEFFDTKYTVYIDGNVRLLTGVDSYLPKTENKTGIAMFTHPQRNCLYREAEACILLGKGNAEAIRQQVAEYREEGLPENFGLKEATMIVCDIDNPICRQVMADWWEEFTRSKSNRDQLALPYVLWKDNLKICDIGDLGSNIRNDLKLQVGSHS